MSESAVSLSVTRLSRGGDGIAIHNGKKIHLPLTAPGDHVEAVITPAAGGVYKGTVTRILTASPQRAEPFCPYYGQCGGCSLQHLSEDSYRAFKTDIAERAATAAGAAPGSYRAAPPLYGERGERKRVAFALGGTKQTPVLGFHARADKAVIPVAECAVCRPDINALIAPLNAALARMKKPGVISSVAIDMLPEGADIILHVKRPLNAAEQQEAAACVEIDGVVRISVCRKDETPRIIAENMRCAAPPGAFAQASERGADALADAVMSAAGEARSVTDLYSGCGAYTLRLARAGVRVNAYEGDNAMTAALHNAAYAEGLSERVSAHTRDLYRAPVPAALLKTSDVVVINPPRNGALPQCKEIAASGVARVVMLSCNPAVFSRDMAVLVSSGYQVTSVRMIDQFYRSAHIELAAVCELPAI